MMNETPFWCFAGYICMIAAIAILDYLLRRRVRW